MAVKNQALSWKATKLVVVHKGKKYSSEIQDDLFLKTLSTVEIKKALNELPGKLSFWTSLKVDLELALEELNQEYDEWFQELYMEVDEMNTKKTEGWKKTKVMMENADDYREWKLQIREVSYSIKKCGAILAGFNAMVWSVREIARLTTAEINNIEISGSSRSGVLGN